ncbi:MAG: DUF6261 family protein [Paludibacter sp.]
MNYKTKINRINIKSLAALGSRIMLTINKSGIPAAKEGKHYLQLKEINSLYHKAGELDDEKLVSVAIKAIYINRRVLFGEIFDYLKGLRTSPNDEVKAAAKLLFIEINRYGKNFRKLQILNQTAQYTIIIRSLSNPEYEAAIALTLLTDKFKTLAQLQQDYESTYMKHRNAKAAKVSPSNLRMQMEHAIKLYVDEVHWMAGRMDSEEWTTLKRNLLNRFDEASVARKRKPKNKGLDENTLSPTTV